VCFLVGSGDSAIVPNFSSNYQDSINSDAISPTTSFQNSLTPEKVQSTTAKRTTTVFTHPTQSFSEISRPYVSGSASSFSAVSTINESSGVFSAVSTIQESSAGASAVSSIQESSGLLVFSTSLNMLTSSSPSLAVSMSSLDLSSSPRLPVSPHFQPTVASSSSSFYLSAPSSATPATDFISSFLLPTPLTSFSSVATFTSSSTSLTTELADGGGSGSAAMLLAIIVVVVTVVIGVMVIVVVVLLCWLRRHRRTGKHSVFENKSFPMNSPNGKK